MFDFLSDDGIIVFVVNGKTADYGPLKIAFADFIGEKYKFTYDELLNLLEGHKYKEYTVPSMIDYNDYDDLFNTLKISFDLYPKEYVKLKDEIVSYLERNVLGEHFMIDQKIILVRKNNSSFSL